MDYQYENLDPERFQQLCQALLVKEFPNVQCFPVGQPDGGRDAISYYHFEKATKNFIVFQVKFVRRPQAETDLHKWLRDIIKEEAPKVKRLIKEGADAYYLLTNVGGTAHPDSGSIDQVKVILSNALKIPANCWWRDDLNRRLDNASDLKWAYPEVMTGQDMLHYVLEAGLLEHKQKLATAIKAFVRKQYEDDKEVRFKQVELINGLFDLFIDVPVSTRRSLSKEEEHKFSLINEIIREHLTVEIANVSGDQFFMREQRNSLGAATMLLHPFIQEHIPYIVLEGAPGQGKSTIAQYICQVHRMRILGMDLDNIPKQHRPLSVRIPFKVDLRHLATWLSKQNPFSPDESKATPEGWHKSLEAFLAAQVRYYSGGFEFSVADLHDLAKLSAFLLVLDGLDEVADISKREEIVAEVIAGVNRLESSAASLQVIVTSRPAAFANSPGFPEDLFPYFELNSLTRSQIDDYADRWTKARSLSMRDKLDLKRTLNEKLNQPHLRDLARNPMQLAILLTLIHARTFLPDERTALYDSYVERYFDRETEKSSIVREHRNLLIDIHQYLAWILHSEAEQGRDRGSISIEKLRLLLADYLTSEGLDSSLADKLFTGAIERIVFLVSRVEGTLEFEVQPLREYFAARFLYETAPYSPPGAAKRGTRPDRFNAIARNFYWLNVTRFYAGCFSKGELPTLVDELQELLQEDGYQYISHPLFLAAMLLSDLVFSQKQKSMREVVLFIIEGLRNRKVLYSKGAHEIPINPLVFPEGCGRREVIEECLTILRNKPPIDYALEMINLLKANSPRQELVDLWQNELSHVVGSERTRWLEFSLYLGILSELEINEMEKVLANDPDNLQDLNIALRAGQSDFLEASEQRSKIIINSILDRADAEKIDLVFPEMNQSPFYILNFYLNLGIIVDFTFPKQSSINNFYRRYLINPKISKSSHSLYTKNHNRAVTECIDFIKVAEKECDRSIKEWHSELDPWDTVIEKSRAIWGDRWANYCLANFVGYVQSKDTFEDFSNLLDHTKSLCRRIFHAKLLAENPEWWKKQFEIASTELEFMFVTLILLTWGSFNTLISLDGFLENTLHSLSAQNWHCIFRSLQQVVRKANDEIKESLPTLDSIVLPDHLHEQIAVAIGIRAGKEDAKKIYQRYFSDYDGSNPIVLDFCQKVILLLVKTQPKMWQQAIDIIARYYAINFMSNDNTLRNLTQELNPKYISNKIAKDITMSPEMYPRQIVYLAEAKNKDVISSKIVSVGTIAKKEKWFED